jgi:hypothetical protein
MAKAELHVGHHSELVADVEPLPLDHGGEHALGVPGASWRRSTGSRPRARAASGQIVEDSAREDITAGEARRLGACPISGFSTTSCTDHKLGPFSLTATIPYLLTSRSALP